MESYHVYFTPRDGVSKEEMTKQVHEFMETQLEENRAKEYRILNMKNKGSFNQIPDFHLIVDYDSEEDIQEAFKEMNMKYKDNPHAPLMKMVSDFKVAFSVDV